MNDVMGVILMKEMENKFGDLTLERAEVALPFGGRYRIIDFVLSSMVNSGIHNVGIVTHNNYQSLIDHLGYGKEWDLARKLSGLFILPPYARRAPARRAYGSVEELHRIMYYLRRSREKYLILSEKSVICNMTYDEVLDFHISREADITIIYNNIEERQSIETADLTVIDTDSNSRVINMEVHPRFPRTDKASMGMYVIRKVLLENLVEECISNAGTDFEIDLLRKNLGNLRVFGYQYDGFVMRINSVRTYFRNNLLLTDRRVMDELFCKGYPIYTKEKDESPTRYGKGAIVSNCLVADGCNIEGEVMNSILFRGVNIAKKAKISNSIIMQSSVIHERSILSNVILDKDVIVRGRKTLIGQPDFPVIVAKRGVV